MRYRARGWLRLATDLTVLVGCGVLVGLLVFFLAYACIGNPVRQLLTQVADEQGLLPPMRDITPP